MKCMKVHYHSHLQPYVVSPPTLGIKQLSTLTLYSYRNLYNSLFILYTKWLFITAQLITD